MKKAPAYKLKHMIAAMTMCVLLAWLTVSLPVVYAYQQQLAKQESKSAQTGLPADSEDSNPLTNSTEEKAPSSTVSEEYLHHTDDHNYLFDFKLSHDNRHAYSVYIAYHGEVPCPPPNFLS